MRAAYLYQCNLLLDHFGASKSFETARLLRALDLYPSGKKEVTLQDAIRLLYTLSASNKVTDVPKAAEWLSTAKNQRGVPLLKELEVLFTIDFRLTEVEVIQISQVTGVTIILYKDGTAESFRPSLDRKDVDKVTMLKKPFLLLFKTELMQNEFSGEIIN